MDSEPRGEDARRVVFGYVVPSAATGDYEVVVCSDGAIFWRPIGGGEWQPDKPVPGTRACKYARTPEESHEH